MRLSDLFRDIDLSAMGVLAMLLFLAVFLAILVRTVVLRAKAEDARLCRLALEEDDGAGTKRETTP